MAQREAGSEVREVVELFVTALDTLSEVADLEQPYTEALAQSKPHVLDALRILRGTFNRVMTERIEAMRPEELQNLDETLTQFGVSSLLRSASTVTFAPESRAMARTPAAREEVGGVKDFIKEIIEEILDLDLLPIPPGIRKILDFVLTLINKLQGKFG